LAPLAVTDTVNRGSMVLPTARSSSEVLTKFTGKGREFGNHTPKNQGGNHSIRIMAARSASRPFQVVVYGATGYTGTLVAEYMAKSAPSTLRWALAGRAEAKVGKAKHVRTAHRFGGRFFFVLFLPRRVHRNRHQSPIPQAP
jgi:hypothetical protein